MNFFVRSIVVMALFSCLFAANAAEAKSETSSVDQLLKRLEPLEQMLQSQQAMLDDQKRKIAEQEQELKQYRAKLDAMDSAPARTKTAKSAATAETTPYPGESGNQKKSGKAETSVAESSGTSITAPKKEKEARPELDVLPSYGGVLTPKGTMMYENSMEYTNTTSNIFTFNGVQVAEVVLIGEIEASSARRQVVQDSSRFRLGITDRLEADVRVPYTYRNDAETRSGTGGTTRTAIEGNGFGDVDFGLAYQFNRGAGGWPYFVGNLRYKSDTGEGPYDIEYDADNIAKTLPTGSGFQSVEGSVTVIKVTDPAVLFGNLGYVHSFGEDIDKEYNTTRILNVSPGDVINASGGLGFSINQETSFSLGYKHSYVFPTYQDAINTTNGDFIKSRSDTLQVGSFMVGTSYRLSPVVSLNFTTEVGATRDAPDVHVGLRIPVRLGQLF